MNVIIVGGGIAGLTACLYAARAELRPHIFVGKYDQGGLLTKTFIVENFPGFPDGILVYDLIVNIEEQCKKYECTFHEESVVSIAREDDGYVIVDTAGNVWKSRSVILAMGSNPRTLELKNEKALWSRGISSCAVCDGALYKGKKIVVVGGGDTACEEALFLTKYSDVILIHRRDELRASSIMKTRVLTHPKIKVLWNTIITELIGDDHLIGIRIRSGDQETVIDVDGLFYGLGLVPNTGIVKGLVQLTSSGHIVARDTHCLDENDDVIPGLFVAGDVADTKYQQAITAAASGCMAVMNL